MLGAAAPRGAPRRQRRNKGGGGERGEEGREERGRGGREGAKEPEKRAGIYDAVPPSGKAQTSVVLSCSLLPTTDQWSQPLSKFLPRRAKFAHGQIEQPKYAQPMEAASRQSRALAEHEKREK